MRWRTGRARQQLANLKSKVHLRPVAIFGFGRALSWPNSLEFAAWPMPGGLSWPVEVAVVASLGYLGAQCTPVTCRQESRPRLR